MSRGVVVVARRVTQRGGEGLSKGSGLATSCPDLAVLGSVRQTKELSMTTVPIGSDARRRLQEAQRAESAALAGTTKAFAALTRAQRRLETAQGEVDRAVAALVDVSGADRAAQLLGQPVGVVRRAQQRCTRTGTAPHGLPQQPSLP
jgi:hypothetical protein